MTPEYFIIPLLMNQFTNIIHNFNTGIYILDAIIVLSFVLMIFLIDFSHVKRNTTNKLYSFFNSTNNTIVISSNEKYRSIKFKSIMLYISNKIDPTIYSLKEHNDYTWNENDNGKIEKSSEYMIDQARIFILDKDIYGQIREDRIEKMTFNGATQYKNVYIFTISTKYKTLIELQNWINLRVDEYNKHLCSKIHDKQLFISILQKNKSSKSESDLLSITSNTWESTCTFKNSYFNMKDSIMKKIDFFLNNKQWYVDHGIPYNLGILLYGEPGCGKTRFIKQLLNYTKRHAIDIKLNDSLDFNELKKIIYNDNINDEFIIPQHERILIFEDIDSMGDIIKDRDLKSKNNDNNEKTTEFIKLTNTNIIDFSKIQIHEKLNNNLSFLLNILDGINECSGRIIIMTTNKIDSLDKALIRPGRIDIMVELKKASRYDISIMIQLFWKINVSIKMIKEDLDGVYTSAEIINIFRSTDNFDEIKNIFFNN